MIARDGSSSSLWQTTTNPYQSPVREFSKIAFDVAIVGGGITGVTLGLQLQKQGKKCVILEAKTLCFGTTGGTTAHINNIMDNTYPQIISDFGKEGGQLVARAAA